MIVIATFNGAEYLERLLGSLRQYGAGGRSVLVVDNVSTDADSLAVLARIEAGEFEGVELMRLRVSHYDTGAYLAAWERYGTSVPDYVFLHDSFEFTAPHGLESLAAPLQAHDVSAYGWFDMNWPSDPFQSVWLPLYFGEAINPDCPGEIEGRPCHRAINGPIFAATSEALARTFSANPHFPLPTSKQQQEAMERVWALAFARSDCAIHFALCEENWRWLEEDGAKGWRKFNPRRL